MILSMTSYGQRLKELHTRLEWVDGLPYGLPLFLWIGNNEEIPDALQDFVSKRPDKVYLKIVDDLKSLKKSYFALQMTEQPIFMLDDDWAYTPNWIMYTVDNYMANRRIHQDCVIGSIGYKVVKNNTGDFEFMMYGDAQNQFQKSLKYVTGHCTPLTPSYKNVILSGGPGSFISVKQLHSDFFNVDLYNELCGGTHDEIWNWVQSIRAGYKHMSMNTVMSLPPCLDSTLGPKLGEINTSDTSNEYMKKLLVYYPEVRRMLELE